MTKTIKINELGELFYNFRDWPTISKEIKLSPKNLYSLIGLKKKIEDEHVKIAETVQAIFSKYDVEPDSRGTYQVPDEKTEVINNELMTFGETTIDISFEPIVVREEDNMPVVLMDKLFDFLRVGE